MNNDEFVYLNRVNSPDDLKKLDERCLDKLCEEIRQLMINTVSQTGGHLASNLGVVELTVALHRVFNSPIDQIVWDVGHQVYAHKIITGRRKGFEDLMLRKEGGLSGFSRPYESEHDIFLSGHSSTSVSSAYGLACAKSISCNEGYVIAVIGDGALSGGLAYEGLNNAGRTKEKIIVILNDNKMSISKNVGSMARYLARTRSKKSYQKFKLHIENFLSKIPFVGNHVAGFVVRLKTVVKNAIYKSNLFEDLGFQYMGPVDGNNLKDLTEALQTAKDIIKRPVLLHIHTVKGKGYSFAEENPRQFHGVSKFDIETGDPINTEKTFSDVFGECMCELAEENNKICAITAAMTVGTGLTEFKRRFPNRFFDVGIAEGHAVTFASGLSKNGMIPVFAVYSTFMQRSFDEIIHDGAMQGLKIIIAVDRAGFVGEDGESHNGLYDVSYLNAIPKVTIFAPSNYAELKKALHNAVYCFPGVTVIRFPRGLQSGMPETGFELYNGYSVFGESYSETAIVTYGRIAADAVKAAGHLTKDGIKTSVIKLNIIKPIPFEAVKAAMNYDKVYFFEEGIRSGGAGQAFASMLMENGYTGKYVLTAVDDCFVSQASISSLLNRFKLDYDGMMEVIGGGSEQEEA